MLPRVVRIEPAYQSPLAR